MARPGRYRSMEETYTGTGMQRIIPSTAILWDLRTRCWKRFMSMRGILCIIRIYAARN